MVYDQLSLLWLESKESKMTHPDVEFDVLVGDRLNIEPNCGDCGHRLSQLKFVQDCCGEGKTCQRLSLSRCHK